MIPQCRGPAKTVAFPSSEGREFCNTFVLDTDHPRIGDFYCADKVRVFPTFRRAQQGAGIGAAEGVRDSTPRIALAPQRLYALPVNCRARPAQALTAGAGAFQAGGDSF